jgi:hypothetical protein
MAAVERDRKPVEVVLPPIDPRAWGAWANEGGRTDGLMAAGARCTGSDGSRGRLVEMVDDGQSRLVCRTS